MSKNTMRTCRAILKRAVSACGRGLSYLWMRTRHNFGLKLLALIFSIILCNIIMTQSNPVRRIQVNEVAVDYVGQDTLRSNKLTLSPESQAGLRQISVTLGVRMQEMSRMDSESVSASVDLASVTEPGEYELPIQVSSELGTVYARSPQKMKVTVEQLVTKTVPVESETSGSIPTGYSISSLSLSPDVITVSGPKSLVDQVYQAVVRLDVSELNKSFTGSQGFILVNEAGGELDSSGIDMSASGVIATVSVKKTVALPVNAALSLTGADQLPEGYQLTDITILPETVNVTGSDAALANVVELTCDAIDIAGLKESKTFTVKLKPIAGLTLETDEVEVVVRVEPKMTTQTFKSLPVRVVNVAEGLAMPEIAEMVDVTVTGLEAVVSRISGDGIDVVIDAQGLTAGTHQVKAQARLDSAYQDAIESGSVTVYPAQLTVTLEPAA